MNLKRIIGERYVRYRLRVGIGQSYTSVLSEIKNAVVAGGVITLLIEKYTHILLPWWAVLIAWAVQNASEYWLGYKDEKDFHLTAYLNNYNAEHLNPYQKEIKQLLTDINDKLPKPPLDY